MAETHSSHCPKSQSDIHTKLHQVQVAHDQILQFRRGVDNSIAELRSIYASSTSRINQIELSLSQSSNRDTNQINISDSTISNGVDSRSTQSTYVNAVARSPQRHETSTDIRHATSTQSTVQATRRQDPDQTYVKTLTNSPQRQHASSHVTSNNVAIRNSRHTGEGITEASTSTGFSVTFGTGDESTQRKTTYNVDDIEKSSDTLRGFIQVTRPHNAYC